jgi:hypothetical protein
MEKTAYVIYSFIISLVLAPLVAGAQINKEKLEKRISVQNGNMRVDSLLNIFSKQTGIEFSFNSQKISPSKIITIKKGTRTLEEWLALLKQTVGINYTVLGNHIILSDHHSSAKQTLPATAKQYTDIGKKNPKDIVPGKSTNKNTSVSSKENKTVYGPAGQNEFTTTPARDTAVMTAIKGKSDPPEIVSNNEKNVVMKKEKRDSVQLEQNDSLSAPAMIVNKNSSTPLNAERLRPLTRLDLGLQGIGFTFERRLGGKMTIDLSAGLGGGYKIDYTPVTKNNVTYELDFLGPAFYFSLTPKFYYNREKRSVKGKTNSLNSGNYIGLRIRYTTKSILESASDRVNDALLMNIHWGMQRAIAKRWTINLHIGAGYITDATDLQNTAGTIYPALDFKFSYIFTKN